jgi:hypothetical protein
MKTFGTGTVHEFYWLAVEEANPNPVVINVPKVESYACPQMTGSITLALSMATALGTCDFNAETEQNECKCNSRGRRLRRVRQSNNNCNAHGT